MVLFVCLFLSSLTGDYSGWEWGWGRGYFCYYSETFYCLSKDYFPTGTEIFSTVSSSNQPDGSLVITWSLDPDLRRFHWNITLTYQLIGTGDCSRTPGEVISVAVNQSDSEFR